MRDWMASVRDTHYIIGSVVGPHPFPMMVRDFQSVIGREAREQSLEQIGRLPDEVIACVGGGSNSAGMFYPFVDDEGVALTGVEAGGRSGDPGEHASTLTYGQPGILHGSYSYVLQDGDGQSRNGPWRMHPRGGGEPDAKLNARGATRAPRLRRELITHLTI